jgi:hypothetical protein
MRAALSVLGFVTVVFVALARAASQDAGKDPAVAAAQARQKSVKTVNMEFKETEVDAKGCISELAAAPFKSKTPVPATETTFESINRLMMDGDKVRYENNHPLWELPTGKFLKRTSVNVFTGSLAKSFRPRGLSGDREPLGDFESAGTLPEMRSSYTLLPVTMTFRGLNPVACAYPIYDLKYSGNELPIDGRPCREYALKLSADLTLSFWLDTARDYVVRRIRQVKENRLAEQFDIQFQPHQACGWTPASWARSLYGPGGAVLMTTSVEVRQIEINDSLPAAQFDLRFPEGTLVIDRRKATQYRVRADGSMRELSSTGEELPGTVAQPGDPWYRRHQWLLLSAGAALLILLLAYGLRRRRRRVPQSQ